MVHTEPWQLSVDNGQPLETTSTSREEFANNPSSRESIFRVAGGEVELLQQASLEVFASMTKEFGAHKLAPRDDFIEKVLS